MLVSRSRLLHGFEDSHFVGFIYYSVLAEPYLLDLCAVHPCFRWLAEHCLREFGSLKTPGHSQANARHIPLLGGQDSDRKNAVTKDNINRHVAGSAAHIMDAALG
jgi:hypothetical protein